MVTRVFNRESSTVVRDFAIIIWGVAILLAALIGAAVVLAMVSIEPNWSEITLAISTAVLALAVAAFFALGSITESRRASNAVQMTELSQRWDMEKNQQLRQMFRDYAEKGLPGVDPVAPAGPDRLKEVILKPEADKAPEYRQAITDPNFLEDIAILIKFSGLDFDMWTYRLATRSRTGGACGNRPSSRGGTTVWKSFTYSSRILRCKSQRRIRNRSS